MGIADIPLEQLIAGWQQARVLAFDIGIARGPWGTRRFIEGIGVGVFAWTLPEADASGTLANLTDADSKIVYALQMLKDRLKGCPPVTVSGRSSPLTGPPRPSDCNAIATAAGKHE